MNISGTTVVLVNGKLSRVLGARFNRALRVDRFMTGFAAGLSVFLPTGERVVPSKNMSWADVAKQVRAGKKVVAKLV